jgi:hypothetical protein
MLESVESLAFGLGPAGSLLVNARRTAARPAAIGLDGEYRLSNASNDRL